MFLLIRTDQPESFVGIYKDQVVSEKKWQAHKRLSDTLLQVIEEQINQTGINWNDLDGIIVFKGPGSFTGLRIGVTVANTLANSQNIPVVGTQSDSWIDDGVSRLANAENDHIVVPEYGGEANITTPRK